MSGREKGRKAFSLESLLLAPYSVWASLFILVPLAFIAYYAFTDNNFHFTLRLGQIPLVPTFLEYLPLLHGILDHRGNFQSFLVNLLSVSPLDIRARFCLFCPEPGIVLSA